MSLHVPLRTRLGLLAFAVVSVTLLAFLLRGTGAPGVPSPAPLRVEATLDDVQGVARQADVLLRGVAVGEVEDLEGVAGGRTRVTLALTRATGVLHADARVGVGAKTPLGEAYIDLDPGRHGPPPRDGARLRARSAVEVDEALRTLDAAARRDLTGVLAATGRGLRSPAAAERVSATTAALARTTARLRAVGRALEGQEEQLTGAVRSSRAVLGALAERGPVLTALVRDARRTATVTAGRRRELGAALDVLPGLLTEADRTLRTIDPLAREAAPLAADLRDAGPALRAALDGLPRTLEDARTVVERVPAAEAAARPALAAARRALVAAAPVAERLGPLVADVVPVARFLGPRGSTAAAWFANTADLGRNGDAKGRWARFFVLFDPATALGAKAAGAPAGNAYTQPGDAARNAPYRPGDYPRLTPHRQALEP